MLSYELSKVQCVEGTNLSEEGYFCLQLILSNTHQRCIYFTSEVAQTYWLESILRQQGYFNKRIHQYVPMKKLGEGSFGRVILAEHQNSKAHVAIKIINKAKIESAFKENGQEFIELELSQRMSKLNCDNLVKVFETFEDEENYCIVTELLQAGDLFKYVCQQPDQPLTEDHAKNVIKQVATGLKKLYDRNIIHRDIKMENIFVSDMSTDATFKLGDLGSAHELTCASDKTGF